MSENKSDEKLDGEMILKNLSKLIRESTIYTLEMSVLQFSLRGERDKESLIALEKEVTNNINEFSKAWDSYMDLRLEKGTKITLQEIKSSLDKMLDVQKQSHELVGKVDSALKKINPSLLTDFETGRKKIVGDRERLVGGKPKNEPSNKPKL